MVLSSENFLLLDEPTNSQEKILRVFCGSIGDLEKTLRVAYNIASLVMRKPSPREIKPERQYRRAQLQPLVMVAT